MFQVEGTLPVALKALNGQTEISSKKIVMRQMTAIEYMQSQSGNADQYIAIADLAAMTKLVDEDGKEHEITYDMLGHSSKSNLEYLNGKLKELEEKEKAEE